MGPKVRTTKLSTKLTYKIAISGSPVSVLLNVLALYDIFSTGTVMFSVYNIQFLPRNAL